MIKRLLRIHFIILTCLLLFNCQKSNSGSLEIVKPGENATLRRTVNIEVHADGLDDIQSVQLFLDDEQLVELNAAPFKYAWNTRDFENGAHDLSAKAVILDGDDLRSDAVNVTISNTLVTGVFTNDWICNTCNQGALVVTDRHGSLLGQASWTGNDTVRLAAVNTTRPDTGYIDVTTVRYDGIGNISITTYLDIEGGDLLRYKGLPRVHLQAFDYMRFSFSNIPSHSGWSISNGFADVWVNPGQIQSSQNVRNYVGNASVYLQLSNTGTGSKYLWLPDQSSGTINVDLGNLAATSSRIIQYPSGISQSRAVLYGYLEEESYYSGTFLLDRRRIMDTAANTMTVHPPPSIMADYKTWMYYYADGGWFYNTVFGDIPESFNRTGADLDFTSAEKDNFEISTSGQFDQTRALWRHSRPSGNVDWNVYGSADRLSYSLPILPELVTDLFPDIHRDQMALVLVDLIDYSELETYRDVIDTRFHTGEYFNTYVRESRTRSKDAPGIPLAQN